MRASCAPGACSRLPACVGRASAVGSRPQRVVAVRGVVEWLEQLFTGKDASASSNGATVVAVPAGGDSPLLDNIEFINPAFKAVDAEAKFMGLLQKVVDSGRCPPELLPLWQDFFSNYKSAIIGSSQAGANEKLVAQVGMPCDLTLRE